MSTLVIQIKDRFKYFTVFNLAGHKLCQQITKADYLIFPLSGHEHDVRFPNKYEIPTVFDLFMFNKRTNFMFRLIEHGKS